MKKKRKIVIIILLISILIVVITIVYTSIPVPILPDRDDLMIGFIKITTGYRETYDTEVIEGYDEDEILEFLQSCSEKRTLEPARGYLGDNVDLEIFIHGTNGNYSKHILLGDINYSYNVDTQVTYKHEIIDPDHVKAILMEMLGIAGE